MTQAQRALKDAGWTVEEFFVACLTLVGTDPKLLLPLLQAHRPEKRPVGRPRRDAE